MIINIPNRIGHGEGGSGVAKLARILEDINNFMELQNSALSGDLLFEITPETVDADIVDQNGESYTRNVDIKLVNSNGDVHEWFNADITISIAEDTASDGVASIDDTSISLVEGQATVEVSLTGTWTASDTNTLTVAEATILGYTVSSVTSVETSIE